MSDYQDIHDELIRAGFNPEDGLFTNYEVGCALTSLNDKIETLQHRRDKILDVILECVDLDDISLIHHKLYEVMYEKY